MSCHASRLCFSLLLLLWWWWCCCCLQRKLSHLRRKLWREAGPPPDLATRLFSERIVYLVRASDCSCGSNAACLHQLIGQLGWRSTVVVSVSAVVFAYSSGHGSSLPVWSCSHTAAAAVHSCNGWTRSIHFPHALHRLLARSCAGSSAYTARPLLLTAFHLMCLLLQGMPIDSSVAELITAQLFVLVQEAPEPIYFYINSTGIAVRQSSSNSSSSRSSNVFCTPVAVAAQQNRLLRPCCLCHAVLLTYLHGLGTTQAPRR
jgi:hypothetical protein